jgi:hypothetical protein
MDEKLESKNASVFECSCSNQVPTFTPYWGRDKAKDKDIQDVYQMAEKKGIEPDKCTGLFFDSISNYENCDDSMPILTKTENDINDSIKEIYKESNEIPQVTTLEEKVIARSSYKKVLALAGLAVQHQNNMFDEMEETISELMNLSWRMESKAKNLQEQLKNLKKLAVLD